MNQPEIVICNPKRTAVGRYGGAFVGVPVQELAATVVTEVIKEAGIEGSLIDDIILGQASPTVPRLPWAAWSPLTRSWA